VQQLCDASQDNSALVGAGGEIGRKLARQDGDFKMKLYLHQLK
jgi:hypothetical protein